MNSTLNIVGCGKLGRTLARLWTDKQSLSVQDIVSRSAASAQSAASFIGAGRAVDGIAAMRVADIWMIATPDEQIAACTAAIAKTGRIAPGTIVFHCSGALSAVELNAVKQAGASVASVHPVASFAEPQQMLARFPGTWCCIEGDAAAVKVLTAAFSAIGGKVIAIDGNCKLIYHAAAVFASNYLVTVLEAAVQAYELAGIPRDTALKIMQPLVQGSAENVFRLGTAAALTGPIARGDIDLVKRQHAALAVQDASIAGLYRELAQATAKLAGRKLEF